MFYSEKLKASLLTLEHLNVPGMDLFSEMYRVPTAATKKYFSIMSCFGLRAFILAET